VAGVVVRAALDVDFDAVGSVHAASRVDAYRHLLHPVTLATITAESQTHQWRTRMPTQPTPHELSVAEARGAVVGFCLVAGDADDAAILNAVHVHPRAQGVGTGRLLVDTACTYARSWGHHTLRLWVLEHNLRARGFYEHLGWVSDGVGRSGEINGEPTTQVRYTRSL
jgi:GNAT superfamily N-acetyltransferase